MLMPSLMRKPRQVSEVLGGVPGLLPGPLPLCSLLRTAAVGRCPASPLVAAMCKAGDLGQLGGEQEGRAGSG